MTEMKITALAPWFGSKRNLAPAIVEELGPHAAYWEPFCGSMAVLLAKPPATHEHVNDLHGDLINLARVIQDRTLGPLLYRRLRRMLMHEAIYEEYRAALRSESMPEDPLERAFAYFICSWFGRNGVSGTSGYNSCAYAVRWTPHGGHGGKRFTSAVESIPAWRRRMRRATILQRDGFELIEKIEDCPGVVLYVDPPYVVKGAKYVHDFEAEDHRRLAGLLGRFDKTRVVVSYYEHSAVEELYRGWTCRRFDVAKALSHGRARGANEKRAVECLYINGPSLAAGSAEPDAALFGDCEVEA